MPAVIKCLVCASEAEFRYDVSAAAIRRSLAALFKDDAIMQIEMADYRMFRCGACQFEFADPQIPGSAAFYNWTVGHEGYYPRDRWEWGVARRRLEDLAATRGETITVVDVGCGAGDFLGVLAGLPNVRAIGIDITAASIAACRARGFEAHCADLEAARELIDGAIDMVTAFHSLEHVADPVDFVRRARDLAGPAGLLMMSTPYSPMSFEEHWFDPLNHPPHHMTRWNEFSYHALAERVGMRSRIIPGPVRDPVRRAMQALSLQWDVGSFDVPGYARASLLFAALRHPVMAIHELYRQIRRRRLHGAAAPDVILVEFGKAA